MNINIYFIVILLATNTQINTCTYIKRMYYAKYNADLNSASL